MILHTEQEDFKDLIEATAKSLNLASIYVEKDYWVTYILKKLSESKYADVAIFKGGTSLSKAYKIIHRFSEDIDLAIINKDLSTNQTKNLIKNIEKAILDENFIEHKTDYTSKGSKFRKTVYEYPKIMDGLWGHAKEQLILELNSFAQPEPYVTKKINTYIYDFLNNQNKEARELIQKYHLEPFDINILDYKRTFCEKISAIARASHDDHNDSNYTNTKSKIRHFYDLFFLMQQDDIQLFIDSGEFISMLKKVRADDEYQFNDDWAKVSFSSVDIFYNTRKVLNDLRAFYENEFKTLVYDHTIMPSIDDLIVSVEKISVILYREVGV